MKPKKAFTLFELLVVVLIIVLLLGKVTTALVKSKERAKSTVDISNLRQIGLAMEMYRSDSGATDYALLDLVNSGRIDLSLTTSPRDNTKEGYAVWLTKNQIAVPDEDHPYLHVRHRLSVVGADAFKLETDECLTTNQANAGWALLFDTMDENTVQPKFGEPYFKLHLDGSVHREIPAFYAVDGGHEIELKALFCREQ